MTWKAPTTQYPELLHKKELGLGIKTKHHILTERIIKNFSFNKYIEVAFLPAWSIERKKFNWRGTWKHRLWHNKAETIAASYEKKLHDKLERALNDRIFRSHQAANEYYAIWQVKDELLRGPLADAEINGVTPDTELGSRELEILESKGMIAVTGDGDNAKLRGIDQTIVYMHSRTMYYLEGMKDIKWKIISAPDDSFVASLSPPERAIIPISHNMLLCGVWKTERHRPEKIKTEEEINQLNNEIISNEKNWIIAKSKKRLLTVKHFAKTHRYPMS